ncbi:unnamed protein product [Prorocentrum cordatum]|uniref:Uncharacterized protein n=1 Tax=Prorocentrum cordatum TaxID=2364126 RepID=A0ABN9Y032_9DINO|nr:unnamed protein product [Polarella glacialis]
MVIDCAERRGLGMVPCWASFFFQHLNLRVRPVERRTVGHLLPGIFGKMAEVVDSAVDSEGAGSDDDDVGSAAVGATWNAQADLEDSELTSDWLVLGHADAIAQPRTRAWAPVRRERTAEDGAAARRRGSWLRSCSLPSRAGRTPAWPSSCASPRRARLLKLPSSRRAWLRTGSARTLTPSSARCPTHA